MAVKLVEVIRAGIVESTHIGSLAVVDSHGNTLYALGDTERLTFYRSAGKPIQAVVSLESGIVDEYKLSLKEIAIMASSHEGEKQHIDNIKTIMEKVNVKEEDFKCGAQVPYSKDAEKELILAGLAPTRLHCNCSGKHIGLISAARKRGLPVESYHEDSHVLQDEIAGIFSEFSNTGLSSMAKGMDGCSIPVYAVPLKNMALSYANLCDNNFAGGKYSKSQNYITSAMTMYPEMVGGEGKLDTVLMKHFGDRIISKSGAEGVYCAGILGKGVGIAVKIEDGNSRAVEPLIVELLVQMKIIGKDEVQKVREFWNPKVKNHKGEVVGEIRATFELKE